MAFVGKSWTFAQLSGAQKIQTLQGWQAPFGRPRQGSIFNGGTSIRRSITYYPDGNTGPTPPTVHVFGTEPKSLELHGRWMDPAIGTVGGARKMVADWKTFVGDKQQVRAKWGDIISYIVFIHDINLEFESEAHVAWKLTADVLVDEQAPVATYTFPKTTPVDFSLQLQQMLAKSTFQAPVPLTINGLLGTLADTIANYVAAINTPFAFVFSVCSALSDFETALSSDLVALSSGLQTMSTGIINLANATEDAMAAAELLNLPTVDTPGGIFSAPDVVTMRALKIQQDRDAANLLGLIASMQREIAIAQRGQSQTAHLGQDGDTWETIAARVFGDPSGAQAIRDANAVKYGQRVQPGKVYGVPRQP